MPYNCSDAPASAIYPDAPGYRRNAPETSRQAAEAVAGVAKSHRDKVLAAFRAVHPHGRSSDQIAAATGLSRHSVRSRVSELFAAGEIERTPDRTRNDIGRAVVLWRAVQ